MENSDDNELNYDDDNEDSEDSIQPEVPEPPPLSRGEVLTPARYAQIQAYNRYFSQRLRTIDGVESDTVPPNMTIPKSDYIPLPPNWDGPVPASQRHLYKKPNIFIRTVSFLRGKRSFTSSQIPYRPQPPLVVFVPVRRSNLQSVSPDSTEEEATVTSQPLEQAVAPPICDEGSSEVQMPDNPEENNKTNEAEVGGGDPGDSDGKQSNK